MTHTDDTLASDKLASILINDKQIIEQQVRVPQPSDRVFKDECAFTFETPESEHGLYICMRTFLGVGRPVVERFFDVTHQRLFLRHLRTRKQIISQSSPKTDENGELKPKRLAIGLEGGFQPDAPQFEYEDHYSVVLVPQFIAVRLPSDRLPDKMQKCIQAILSADAASRAAESKAGQATWDGEFRVVSKHYENLLQIPPERRIPPGPRWQCEHPGCNITESLWLNLSSGRILCGRKMWDNTGGNNHGADHYRDNPQFPLAVKLGTITPEGADVYSYEEDDMVLDPKLSEHLQHWGIDVASMKKTEKTQAELEIEWNQKVGEWTKLTESDTVLQDVYGPGYTGMENLGNSCYMNSVMQVSEEWTKLHATHVDGAEFEVFEGPLIQVMFSVDPFINDYARPDHYDHLCFGPDAVIAKQSSNTGGKTPPDDFNTQLAKLGCGLVSGLYSQLPPATANNPNSGGPPQAKQNADSKTDQAHRQGIRPTMFKNMIGKDHADFGTKLQQDAYEFFLHLLSMIERNNVGRDTPGDLFKFEWQIQTKCSESMGVRYSKRLDNAWSLRIPIEQALNRADVQKYEQRKAEAEARGDKLPDSDHVRPSVPLSECIKCYLEATTVEDFYSTAVKKKVTAWQLARFASFPKYLLIRLERYVIQGNDWNAKKLDVSVHVPDTLNLEDSALFGGVSVRGTGFDQRTDTMLPDETEDDRRIMREQAEVETRERLSRQQQKDQQTRQQQQQKDTEKNEEIAQKLIVDLGFPVGASRKAAFNAKGSFEAAVNWVMEHPDDPDYNNDDWQAPLGPSMQALSQELPQHAGNSPAWGNSPGWGGSTAIGVSNVGVDEQPSEHHISAISEMGFNRPQAIFALRNTQNNVERAIDWIFNHQDELIVIQTDADLQVALEGLRRPNAPVPPSPTPQQQDHRPTFDAHAVLASQVDAFNPNVYAPQQPSSYAATDELKLNDGPGRYQLKAFISHMGPNTSSGHYVCHIKKRDRWVIFNDEKVALSENPPRDLGYLYLFERCDK